MENLLVDGMLGLAVGDALGVPAEGKSREEMKASPITELMGGGIYNQQAGTWSDVTSMAMCTLDSLVHNSDEDGKHIVFDDLMQRLLVWKMDKGYTPHEEIFRYDEVMFQAISDFANGSVPMNCGAGADTLDEKDTYSALARMFPFAYYQQLKYESWQIRDLTEEEIERVHDLAALSNGSMVSKVACGIYTAVIREIVMGIRPAKDAILSGIKQAFDFYDRFEEYAEALKRFEILRRLESGVDESEISSGYSSSEIVTAAIWSAYQSCTAETETENSFLATVIRAVNLGGNTPTIGALAGSIAGCLWGYESIPEEWKNIISRRVWIEDVCRAYHEDHSSDKTAIEEQMNFQ